MKAPTNSPIFCMIWKGASEVAREHGYALAVHGSMERDIDLLACPWTEEASDAETLMKAIAHRYGFLVNGEPHVSGPTPKPHGRISWAIPLAGTGNAIDLSVMPRSRDLGLPWPP